MTAPTRPRSYSRRVALEPEFTLTQLGDLTVAELLAGVVQDERDATDLVGNASFLEADYVLLRTDQLAPEFFDLSSGLAGAVTQKFANYRLGLIVAGPLPRVASESLEAFIIESNRGSQLAFVPDRDAALLRLENR